MEKGMPLCFKTTTGIFIEPLTLTSKTEKYFDYNALSLWLPGHSTSIPINLIYCPSKAYTRTMP